MYDLLGSLGDYVASMKLETSKIAREFGDWHFEVKKHIKTHISLDSSVCPHVVATLLSAVPFPTHELQEISHRHPPLFRPQEFNPHSASAGDDV